MNSALEHHSKPEKSLIDGMAATAAIDSGKCLSVLIISLERDLCADFILLKFRSEGYSVTRINLDDKLGLFIRGKGPNFEFGFCFAQNTLRTVPLPGVVYVSSSVYRMQQYLEMLTNAEWTALFHYFESNTVSVINSPLSFYRTNNKIIQYFKAVSAGFTIPSFCYPIARPADWKEEFKLGAALARPLYGTKITSQLIDSEKGRMQVALKHSHRLQTEHPPAEWYTGYLAQQMIELGFVCRVFILNGVLFSWRSAKCDGVTLPIGDWSTPSQNQFESFELSDGLKQSCLRFADGLNSDAILIDLGVDHSNSYYFLDANPLVDYVSWQRLLGTEKMGEYAFLAVRTRLQNK